MHNCPKDSQSMDKYNGLTYSMQKGRGCRKGGVAVLGGVSPSLMQLTPMILGRIGKDNSWQDLLSSRSAH